MRRYEHVIIIGVDGGGHFLREGDTPCFDRIFKDGAVTYEALASYPSISAECWSSLLTGVSPYCHGRTNDVLSKEKLPKDFPYKTCFRVVREAFPDAVIGAYCDWNAIIHGLVEDDIGVDCLNKNDAELIAPLCEYILQKKPDFLFAHFDSVDHEGHANGYGMPRYMQQIHTADAYVGKVYDAVKEAGIIDSTLFCVICDHGGTVELKEDGSGYIGHHGGWTYNERSITFAATGKDVVPGAVGEMNIRDLSAIVRYAFGLSMPAFDINGWTSQIPQHLFKDIDTPYEDISSEQAAAPRVSNAQHGTQLT